MVGVPAVAPCRDAALLDQLDAHPGPKLQRIPTPRAVQHLMSRSRCCWRVVRTRWSIADVGARAGRFLLGSVADKVPRTFLIPVLLNGMNRH